MGSATSSRRGTLYQRDTRMTSCRVRSMGDAEVTHMTFENDDDDEWDVYLVRVQHPAEIVQRTKRNVCILGTNEMLIKARDTRHATHAYFECNLAGDDHARVQMFVEQVRAADSADSADSALGREADSALGREADSALGREADSALGREPGL